MVPGQNFIGTPTGRNVIENNVFLVSFAEGVAFMVRSHSKVADDHITGVDAQISL